MNEKFMLASTQDFNRLCQVLLQPNQPLRGFTNQSFNNTDGVTDINFLRFILQGKLMRIYCKESEGINLRISIYCFGNVVLNLFTSLWEETAWGVREKPFNISQLPGIHVCSKLHFSVNSLRVVVGQEWGRGREHDK